MVYLLLFLLTISVFLEGTVTSLPLVLVCFVCLTIIMRSPIIFFLAFLAGILLDAFSLHVIGGTSIFFLISIFLILLYQRKYEINTYPFVIIASFAGTLMYLLVFGYSNVILQACVSALFGTILYAAVRYATQEFSIN